MAVLNFNPSLSNVGLLGVNFNEISNNIVDTVVKGIHNKRVEFLSSIPFTENLVEEIQSDFDVTKELSDLQRKNDDLILEYKKSIKELDMSRLVDIQNSILELTKKRLELENKDSNINFSEIITTNNENRERVVESLLKVESSTNESALVFKKQINELKTNETVNITNLLEHNEKDSKVREDYREDSKDFFDFEIKSTEDILDYLKSMVAQLSGIHKEMSSTGTGISDLLTESRNRNKKASKVEKAKSKVSKADKVKAEKLDKAKTVKTEKVSKIEKVKSEKLEKITKADKTKAAKLEKIKSTKIDKAAKVAKVAKIDKATKAAKVTKVSKLAKAGTGLATTLKSTGSKVATKAAPLAAKAIPAITTAATSAAAGTTAAVAAAGAAGYGVGTLIDKAASAIIEDVTEGESKNIGEYLQTIRTKEINEKERNKNIKKWKPRLSPLAFELAGGEKYFSPLHVFPLQQMGKFVFDEKGLIVVNSEVEPKTEKKEKVDLKEKTPSVISRVELKDTGVKVDSSIKKEMSKTDTLDKVIKENGERPINVVSEPKVVPIPPKQPSNTGYRPSSDSMVDSGVDAVRTFLT